MWVLTVRINEEFIRQKNDFASHSCAFRKILFFSQLIRFREFECGIFHNVVLYANAVFAAANEFFNRSPQSFLGSCIGAAKKVFVRSRSGGATGRRRRRSSSTESKEQFLT